MDSRDARTMCGPTRAVEEADLLLPQRVDEPVVVRLTDCEVEQLAVFVGGADSYHEGRLPVAGQYEHHGEFLVFTPAFGFAVGQDYVVRTRRHGGPHLLTEFRIPVDAAAALALVTDVYPSSDVLPENVLRFYVHFSVPMAPHLASDFVTLRDASGAPDPAAFMQFKQELWNEDRTRLTVLIDPGRIKRSVATNLDLGAALIEGKRYALTINEGWPSADGLSVLPAFSKSFRVAGALRARPDVAYWTWQSPRAGTRETLEITFDRPFDRHLLRGALQVVASDGQAIDGTTRVGVSESSWSFTPDEPWATCDVRVTVDDALEDVAGNSFRELLDRDISDKDRR